MEAAVSNPTGEGIESAVGRIRGLIERNEFLAALALAESLLSAVPENRDVLYMIAVSQRYLARIDDALAMLAVLERHHPTFSRLFQERGHCYVALRDAQRAVPAFLQAVNLNAALPASWQALHALYRMMGDAKNADTAADHVATLARLPAEIVAATGMFSDGDWVPAENIVRAFLLEHGNHVEAMRLLARIGLERDVLDDAELLLGAVLTLAPDYRAARYDYATALLRRHKHAEAAAQLDRLLKLEPRNRLYRTTYASTVVGMGDHERALELYQDLAADAPRAADVQLSIAHSLKTLGRMQMAVEAYRGAIAVRPDYGDAYWSLANLKTYRFTNAEIERMRARDLDPVTKLVDRYHLCFALGKALEDRGEFAESFGYYARGNALKRSETQYSPEPLERVSQLQTTVCTREFFSARRGGGCPSGDPIFIVGMPRAGSTLLEQILASHSRVDGTMELANIPRLVHELQGREPDSRNPRYPCVLEDLGPDDFLRFGRNYLDGTRLYRSGRPRFIDKMPNNFRHIGLIHLILPNAKIIDARRNALACCFGNFKQLFAAGQEFTYGLEDVGRYYRMYVELMHHWDSVLPGKVLRINHEDVVDDLEANVRKLLDFCGLQFEPACVEFHKTARSIRTASSEQVRRPIFREGLDQWRHYDPWLEPLKTVLGPLVAVE